MDWTGSSKTSPSILVAHKLSLQASSLAFWKLLVIFLTASRQIDLHKIYNKGNKQIATAMLPGKSEAKEGKQRQQGSLPISSFFFLIGFAILHKHMAKSVFSWFAHESLFNKCIKAVQRTISYICVIHQGLPGLLWKKELKYSLGPGDGQIFSSYFS